MGRPRSHEADSPLRRVLMVTYDFPPSTEIGGHACAQIARHLPRYGWEPVILTVREKYFVQRDQRSPDLEVGRVVRTRVLPHLLALYRRIKVRRSAGGVDQRSGGVSVAGSGRLRRQLLSVLTVPDAHTGWLLPAVAAGLVVIRRSAIGHLFSSGPAWTNHLVGLALARISGLRWTAHFRDPWAQGQEWRGVTPLAARIDGLLERSVVTRADSVVCVTSAHTASLRERYPELPASKFVTIPNGYDGSEWEPAALEADGGPAAEGQFVITYAGSLYMGRNPEPLLRALTALAGTGDVDLDRVRVDLLGDCALVNGRRVGDLIAECGLVGRVHVTGQLGRAETLRRMGRSNLLLLLAEGLTSQIPGKTYEYLRTGRPILAFAGKGSVAELLQTAGGAWIVDPSDAVAVSDAVRELYRRWKNGLPSPGPDPGVVAAFDRRVLTARFAELFAGSASRTES